ncbi:MAG: class I SAM-dependent methyltransferase [Thermoguttaceae bacterium]|nr:class I SAM-dependent methyltransferase [Thermoguttaceae bacterium]MDW8039716.1 class I SAM-dependent methyltransferase [Thermoguttaceae bacterium]
MRVVDRICMMVGIGLVGVGLVRLMGFWDYSEGQGRSLGAVPAVAEEATQPGAVPGGAPGRAGPGAVSGKEGAGRPRPEPFGPPRLPVMTALDTDGDGSLSAEEIAKAPETLKKLDKNGDGQLNREELFGTFRVPGMGPGPGFGPGGPVPGGPVRPMPGQPGAQAGLETPPQPKDDEEKKLLSLILEEIPREQGRRMNVPPVDGRLLRLLAEAIEAKTIVEIGTSNGISALWMGLALRKTGGKLITHEIDPHVAALARKNFERAGMADMITVVEGDAHQTIGQLKGPIDMVFIDADKEGYMDYLQKLLPLLRPGGIICAHNVNARWADSPFFKAITTDGNLETLLFTAGGGMSITIKKR